VAGRSELPDGAGAGAAIEELVPVVAAVAVVRVPDEAVPSECAERAWARGRSTNQRAAATVRLRTAKAAKAVRALRRR